MSIQNVESAFQEIARYDDPLDLAGTLVDLQKLGIAHQLLDRAIRRFPIRASRFSAAGPRCT
jgi:hypothetical protein